MFEEEDIPPASPPTPQVLKLSQKVNELPRYTAYKHFIPDEHSERTVQMAQGLYGTVIQELTTNREKHIFKGVLNLEDKAVFCKGRKAKGNAFNNMGVQSCLGFRFQPEEALIQFEYGVLEVFMSEESKVPMCMQDLYDIMIPWISLEFYQAYCHLVRLGYVVKRADPNIPSNNFISEKERLSKSHVMSSNYVTSPAVNVRILKVRKPLSVQTDFHVVILKSCRTFPSLKNILEIIRIVGRTSIKIARVTDGKIYFYSLAMVDFPDADEIS